MLTHENIVCFAKDWTEDPTSNNHVMRMLARDNRVLWLNSIAMRTPKLTSGRDLKKIRDKILGFAKGPTKVDVGAANGSGLEVYTPIVLPLPHSDVATAINEKILKQSIGLLRRRRGMKDFQLWTFLPTVEKYFGKLGESFRVYYCTDEFSHFSHLDKDRIVAMERALIQKADIVFCTARTLVERKGQYNPNTFLASHGVDYAHFAKSLDPGTKVADEIAHLEGPVIGFVGLLENWVDLDAIAYMAGRHPDWSFVIIGRAMVDISKYAVHKNMLFLGRKPYADLPSYTKKFDVALIPFTLNELTRNVNPIKLREYFSAGLPVVSSDMPEVRYYEECLIAKSHEDYDALVQKALREDSPERRRARSDAMKKETWEEKVKALGEHIARVREQKRARA
jgi:glycosyltransferase involved in cell wall biosynthesis